MTVRKFLGNQDYTWAGSCFNETGEILWHSADIVGDQQPTLIGGYRQHTLVIKTCQTSFVSGLKLNYRLTTFEASDNWPADEPP